MDDFNDILCSSENSSSSDEEECITQEMFEVSIVFPTEPKPPFNDSIQFKRLKKERIIVQKSDEWFTVRKTMLTASTLHDALKKSNKSLIKKKCETSKPFKGSDATRWGIKYEDVAIKFYELHNNVEVHEFGVIRHKLYHFIGASPDGITPQGIMIEIKCPFSRKIITGKIPEKYLTQVQAQLEVCNLSYCDYLECKIKEYKSLKHYIDDTKNHNKKVLKTIDNSDKGCIITYIDSKNEEKYYYSELGINEEQFINWKLDIKTQTTGLNLTYKNDTFYRINEMNCVRVERDKKWFLTRLPRFQDTWSQIEARRKEIGYYSEHKIDEEENTMLELSTDEEQLNYTVNINIKEGISINTLSDCKNRIASLVPILNITDDSYAYEINFLDLCNMVDLLKRTTSSLLY